MSNGPHHYHPTLIDFGRLRGWLIDVAFHGLFIQDYCMAEGRYQHVALAWKKQEVNK